MRIVSIGGGPAGLYFALLMKKADPAHEVTVVERNRPDDTFGFGVVFSDATLEGFAEADPETHAAITRSFAHWDDIDIHYGGAVVTSTGHGFAGMARQRLLDILQRRCADLGVKLGRDGALEADPKTGATNRAGVFAGGGASVVHAMAAGKRAALAMDAYLVERKTSPA